MIIKYITNYNQYFSIYKYNNINYQINIKLIQNYNGKKFIKSYLKYAKLMIKRL